VFKRTRVKIYVAPTWAWLKATERVLVFAAHPDDELVEAGGTICRLRREDCAVRVMLFSRGGGGLAASGTWKPLVSVAWRH
jgi:LmbE family N-acetylglucosaminyl deacetylase